MSIRGDRGTVTIFTVLSMAFLLAMGGFAIDLVHLTAVRAELQRSMDAAALAGAGNLGVGDYKFGDARANTQTYAGLSANGYRGGTNGTISLNLNAGNAANGNITLGTFQDGAFTASTDGAVVNAVKARYDTTIPASFLRILGFDTLAVSAQAIAVASPPRRPEAGSCLLPVGVSKCAFRQDPADPTSGFNSSRGCGRLVTFYASGNLAGTPVEAAWVNLGGTTAPGAADLSPPIAASSGTGCAFDLAVDPNQPGLGVSGGSFIGPAAAIRDQLRNHRTSGVHVTGFTGVTEQTGWPVTVPVLDIPCPEPTRPPAGTYTGTYQIVGWTKVVLTAFDFQGSNDPTVSVLPLPPGVAPTPGRRTVYGYISCESFDAEYNPAPAPISAISRRLHLVQ